MNDEPHAPAVRDGTRIAYAVTPGDGPARFALVHSLAMGGGFWEPVIARLRQAGDVLAVDCRGHGGSDVPPGPYTVELFADDLADVMDDLGWDSAVVGGCSMGGCVALAFAEAYPMRAEALALIDTTAWYGPDAPAQWEERAAKARAEGMAALVGFQTTRWFSDGFRAEHPETVDAAAAAFLATDVEGFAETCRMLGRCDLRAGLGRIAAPVSIVVGNEDTATPPAMAEALHQAIHGSTLEVLKGVRHLSPLERPDLIAARLKALAERA